MHISGKINDSHSHSVIYPHRPEAVFVVHVKKGYEERSTHIARMLGRVGIAFEFMFDGDIADITPAVLDQYFSGSMHVASAQTSCALKHLLICKDIVSRNLPGALVLEDDIVLGKRFAEVFAKSMTELSEMDSREPAPRFISYEDTRQRFVPRSRRHRDTVLYPGDRDRMAGAYYINRRAAELILQEAEQRKMDRPIDLFHRRLLDDGMLQYLWCQPTVATQGSHNGMFASQLNINKRFWEPLVWRGKLAYKKLLYNLR